MEEEPLMRLNTNDGELEVTRDKGILYRFAGALAMYDHAFFITNLEEHKGVYLFNLHPSFEDIAEFMLAHDFPAHLNLREVAECDLNAFNSMVARETEDEFGHGIPEDWDNES